MPELISLSKIHINPKYIIAIKSYSAGDIDDENHCRIEKSFYRIICNGITEKYNIDILEGTRDYSSLDSFLYLSKD